MRYQAAKTYAFTLIRKTPGLSSMPSIRQFLPAWSPQAWWLATMSPLSWRAAGALAAAPAFDFFLLLWFSRPYRADD